MFNEYWGLTEKPFRSTPDPKFLYYSPQHKDALMKLVYCAQEMLGAAMLTGVFGCGKTVIANALLQQLNPEKFRIAFIRHPRATAAENLVAIAMELGDRDIINKSHQTQFIESLAIESLKNILNNNHDDGRETLVIIDEAHILDDPKIFEYLRLLLNFQLMDKFLLTLILIGQPDLRQKIDNFKQFEQRIAVKAHLDVLNKEETANYIGHRINVAGRKEAIFTDDAISLIFEYAGGIPRRVNRICDLCLLAGFTHKLERIDAGIVQGQAFLLAPERFKTTKEQASSVTAQPDIGIKISDIKANERETEQFYQNGLILSENLFNRAEKNEPLDTKAVAFYLEQLVDKLKQGNFNLIKLLTNISAENHLYSHVLNVAILSIIIGLGLGYDRGKLIVIGTGAFLHDLGLIRLKDIILKPYKLSPEEYEEVKKHPIYSKQILEESRYIVDAAKDIALYHHERMNGAGYPKGLKGPEIQEWVKIVSICDVFEAITHDRPWRPALSPYDAMKILRDESGELFDANIVKVLMEHISVYPVGSLVKLNTQEIAQVLKVEGGFPRFIEILRDASGNRFDKPRLVNLFEYPNLYIEKGLTKKEVYKDSDSSLTSDIKERPLKNYL